MVLLIHAREGLKKLTTLILRVIQLDQRAKIMLLLGTSKKELLLSYVCLFKQKRKKRVEKTERLQQKL